jgi:hypothetical protein
MTHDMQLPSLNVLVTCTKKQSSDSFCNLLLAFYPATPPKAIFEPLAYEWRFFLGLTLATATPLLLPATRDARHAIREPGFCGRSLSA